MGEARRREKLGLKPRSNNEWKKILKSGEIKYLNVGRLFNWSPKYGGTHAK